MLILPAIDLRDGAVVRLRQGDYGQSTLYDRDPASVATMFASAGFRHLHVVDLDGAREGSAVNASAIGAILDVPGVQVELGGGIRDRSAIDRALERGVWRVMIGSAAVRSPEMVQEAVEAIGPERVCLAVDMKEGQLAVNGWTDGSPAAPDEFIRRFLDLGVRTFHGTDVSRDGMLQGPNVAWYDALRRRFPEADLIAAGGVSSISDLDTLREVGLNGAVIGRALYEGSLPLDTLRSWSRGGQ